MASDPITAPLIDSRSEADIVTQTTALADYFTGAHAGTNDELRKALVGVFARMVSRVVERLNQVPENNHLAFLGLLGAQQMPPRAARVPVTFLLVPGAQAPGVVPAGTLVAAPAAGDVAESVFATESDLVLTTAALQSVLVWRPPFDTYLDATGVASGAQAGAFVAFTPVALPASDTSIPHAIHVTDPSFAAPGGSLDVAVTVTLAAARTAVGVANAVRLATWNGAGWSLLAAGTATATDATNTKWRVAWTGLPLPLPAAPIGAGGPWLRCAWMEPIAPGTPAPVHDAAISATVTLNASPSDKAFTNTSPVDLTKDFLPFGDRPRMGDVFYVAASNVLQPNAVLTATIGVSALGASPPTPIKPTVVWEVWDGTSWNAGTNVVDNTVGLTADQKTATFTLPSSIGTTTVAGVAGPFLRVRVAAPVPTSDDYTKAPFNQYTPPSLKSLTLTAKSTLTFTKGDVQNGFDHAPWTPATTPFTAVPETAVAIYFGFDRAFAAADAVTLYLEVDPPTPDEVGATDTSSAVPADAHVVWEYSAAASGTPTWSLLTVDDETLTLARSGLVRFVAPADSAPAAVLGKTQYWIRARLVSSAPLPLQRRLRHVSVNTVWASHATTIVGEVIGSSDGSPGQTYGFSQTPVLLGQKIEVDEGVMPPSDQLAAIRALEGDDAVTQVAASAANRAQVWVRWHEVTDFYASGPLDRHYVMDHVAGTVQFGDGANGMIPVARPQNVRAAWYQTGGGASGNRAAGSITQLRAALPFVQGVVNYEDAGGGADAETLDRVKDRSSRILRHGWRAVTVQDYADLAFEASPAVARASVIPPTFDPTDQAQGAVPAKVIQPGKVLVVVVPQSAAAKPVPSPDLLAQVTDYLRARCAPAVVLQVTGPRWASITVTAQIALASLDASEVVRSRVLDAIEQFLHPLTGGPDGQGWAFGQQPHESDFYLLLSRIPGVDHVPALAVACDTKLEFLKNDTGGSDPNVQRFVPTYLVYSSGQHVITPVLR